MKQSVYEVPVLEPEEGNFLTQADDNVSIANRIIGKRVYLGINDSAESWKEISAEEAEEIRKLKEEEFAKLNEQR